MYLHICAYMIALISLAVIILDIYPLLTDWISRIHIGRMVEISKWSEAIQNKSLHWLHQTPKIKVTDHTRLIVIDKLRGNYSSNTIQHWQEAALLLGLEQCKQNDKISETVSNYLNDIFDEKGNWRNEPVHVDVAILAYATMKQSYIDSSQFKPAFDYTWKLIQDHLGEDGTVGYRKTMSNYRYVDTIGFICPFLIAYGTKYQIVECIDLAIKQIQEYSKHGMLTNSQVPCHAYQMKTKMPLGLYGWGRGLGWYAIGLIDSWNELPSNHKYKKVLEKKVVEFAEEVLGYQQDQGNWNWTVTRNEAKADSSATATLCWFLLNASKIEGISEQCIASSEKALKFLMSVTRRNGAIDFSQGDTKDIGVYSSLFNILPFTQGFSVRSVQYYQYIVKERSTYCNNKLPIKEQVII